MGRVIRQYSSDSKEAYESFCKEYPQYNLPYKTWRKIIFNINYSYVDYILQSGDKVRIPSGFGDLAINKKKNAKFHVDPETGKEKICLPVNWPESKKRGKKIYILNDHTNGYYFGWIYFRETGKMRFSSTWTFKACRRSSRLLGQYIKDTENDWVSLYRVWQNYRTSR